MPERWHSTCKASTHSASRDRENTVHVVDLYILASLGVVSSLHCTMMCGPILAVALAPAALRPEGRPRRIAWLGGQALYQTGRVLSYASLGLGLGLAGGALFRLPGPAWLGGAVQIALGFGLLGMGFLGALGLRASPSWPAVAPKLLRRIVTSQTPWGMLLLGLLAGVLPCGVLWGALSVALATGSPTGGALGMVAFWLGTLPLLAAVGFVGAPVVRIAGRFAPALVFLALSGSGVWIGLRGARNLHASAPAAADGMPASCPMHHAASVGSAP
jgi:uncharacterized protein